jgi:hypothetical protein
MSNFWESKTGTPITGNPNDAFVKDFSIIPDGTTAVARIKTFEIIEKNSEYRGPEKYMQITYKITSGEFNDREVTQKIKPFDGEPKAIDRNLNMLKLVMDLCDFRPNHTGEPTSDDLKRMTGRILGIKIREWSLPKKDGSGIMEGNFVSEVAAASGFVVETGIKAVHVHSMPTDTALSRNSNARVDGGMPGIDDDLPF